MVVAVLVSGMGTSATVGACAVVAVLVAVSGNSATVGMVLVFWCYTSGLTGAPMTRPGLYPSHPTFLCLPSLNPVPFMEKHVWISISIIR